MADRRAARPPALQCATSEARPSIKHNHEALQDSQLTASKEAGATRKEAEGYLVVCIGVYLGDCKKHSCAGQSRLIRSALLAIGSFLGTWRTSVTVAALRGTTAKRTI